MQFVRPSLSMMVRSQHTLQTQRLRVAEAIRHRRSVNEAKTAYQLLLMSDLHTVGPSFTPRAIDASGPFAYKHRSALVLGRATATAVTPKWWGEAGAPSAATGASPNVIRCRTSRCVVAGPEHGRCRQSSSAAQYCLPHGRDRRG